MRILILSHAQYITVGLPKVIEYAESLALLGNEVTLCVTSRTKKIGIHTHIANGIQIVESPSLFLGNFRHGADPFDAMNRIRFLRKRAFDVIHCMASRPTVFYPGVFLKKSKGAVLIYEWEDSFASGGVALERRGKVYYRFFGRIEKYFEEAILKHCDGVIVVSDFLARRAVELGVGGQSILHQIKGTKLIEQEFPDKDTAKRELCYDYVDDEIVFTYVGAIYKSDLDLLLESFEVISKSNSRIKLVLVGYNSKPPNHIPSNVSVLPRVPDKEYYLHLAATDVFVLPLKNSVANISRYPSKFGDYLAVGRPVVTTPHPEIGKIVESGNCGYISDDDSVQSFSSAMLNALENRASWPVLSQNAKAYALSNLSWRTISKRTQLFYESVLNQKT